MGLTCLLVLSVVVVGILCIHCGIKGKKVKRFLGLNIASVFALLVGFTAFTVNHSVAAAADVAGAAVNSSAGFGYLGAALSTGLACVGAGIAVGISGSAALGAISEDSKLLGKTLIFVGLAEGIAIYGLIVSILILGQL